MTGRKVHGNQKHIAAVAGRDERESFRVKLFGEQVGGGVSPRAKGEVVIGRFAANNLDCTCSSLGDHGIGARRRNAEHSLEATRLCRVLQLEVV